MGAVDGQTHLGALAIVWTSNAGSYARVEMKGTVRKEWIGELPSVWLGVRGEGRGATGAPGFPACVTGQLVTETGRSTGRCFGL